MKVDNPRFGIRGVYCSDCPFTEKDGRLRRQYHGKGMCICPTDTVTYAAACALAASVDKGE